VTQYPMTTLEELGLLKMDFLALRNLTVLDDAVQLVKKHTPAFSIKEISENDPATFQMLSEGRTSGVFQMESAGMTGVCVGLKPKDVEDITAIIALYRPGPMESIPRFIACKQDPSLIRYKHPLLKPILSVTYGCIVYQEQVIEIFRRLGGYSLGQADMMRRAISKKKAKEIEKERKAFIYGDAARNIDGCIARGIPEDTAQDIYNEIFDFANYAFNKAHAVCYAVVAYETAWFKCHYPREYMAALLTSVLDSQDKVAEYISECKATGIQLLPPDINLSGSDFTVSRTDIRFGLSALKGVGRGFTNAVLAERQRGGSFTSFPDFCRRMLDFDLNKRVLESLIKSGAFDRMGCRRSQLLDAYEQLVDDMVRSRRRNLEGQFDLFSAGNQSPEEAHLVLRDLPEFSPRELMNMEKEITGLYLSGHPMDEYKDLAVLRDTVSMGAILSDFAREEGPARFREDQKVTLAGIVTSVKTKTTKNDSLMAYVTLEDDTGTMELLVFSRVLGESGSYLHSSVPILAEGRISVREEKAPQLMCDRVLPLSQAATGDSAHSEPVFQGQGGKLYLRFESAHSPLFEKIRKIFVMFPGNSQAVFYFADTGKRLGTRCVLHEALLAELQDLLGKDNVVVK